MQVALASQLVKIVPSRRGYQQPGLQLPLVPLLKWDEYFQLFPTNVLIQSLIGQTPIGGNIQWLFPIHDEQKYHIRNNSSLQKSFFECGPGQFFAIAHSLDDLVNSPERACAATTLEKQLQVKLKYSISYRKQKITFNSSSLLEFVNIRAPNTEPPITSG